MSRDRMAAIDARVARLSWHLRRGWDAVSLADLAGLAALGVWIGLSLVVDLPLRREVDALRRMPPSPAAASASLRESAPSGRIDAFMRFLPPIDLRDQQLRSFHALARESGVKIAAIDYVPGDLAHLPGRRMVLRVSAAADAASYRKFVHDMLAGLPNLAIDSLSTQADAAQPGRLEVRLESSLYYRRAGAADRGEP